MFNTNKSTNPDLEPSTKSTSEKPDRSEFCQRKRLLITNQLDTQSLHALVLRHGAEFKGTEQILDTYFDTRDNVLFKNGLVCCYRETGEQAALILLVVDEYGINKCTDRTLVQSIDMKGDTRYLDISSLPDGECKSILAKLAGKEDIAQLFNVKIIRNHYSMKKGIHEYNASLDAVYIRCHAPGHGHNELLTHSELVINNFDVDVVSVSEIQASLDFLETFPAPSNHYQRACKHMGGWLHALNMKHKEHLQNQSSGHGLLRAALSNQLELIHYWHSVAIEDQDIEGVHQIRVAIRSIRSMLKTWAPMLSKSDCDRWQTQFRWVGKRLGAVRDQDVFLEWLEDLGKQQNPDDKLLLDNYVTAVVELRKKAVQGLRGALVSDRYKQLLIDFSEWLNQERCFFVHRSIAYKPVEEQAAYLMNRAQKRMRKKATCINDKCHPTELHDFRIECKRLRYTLESFKFYASKDQKKLARLCKKLQTELGDHQDIYEHAIKIRSYAVNKSSEASGEVNNNALLFSLGELYAKMQTENERQRLEFNSKWDEQKKLLLELSSCKRK